MDRSPFDPDPVDGVPELIPARMLNEFIYCPRLFHLEWAQSEWADSDDTIAGARDHRVVDRESKGPPPPEEVGEEPFVSRSVLLSAEGEGLIARLDLLEGREGEVVPIDYKHGRPPEGPDLVWDTDRVQIGAQALILLENGYRCREGIVYYVPAKRRVTIPIDDELLFWTRRAVAEARRTAAAPESPPPLVDSPKCPRCSLVGICLPDELNHLTGSGDPEPEDVRRLYAARDDAQPVYVQAQGAKVGKRGEQLEIWERDKGTQRVRLIDVSQLALFGNVTVTTQAIGALLRQGAPICHFTYGGWFRGITHGLGSRNGYLRMHQYRAANDPARCLELARGMVERKILNTRTLLRRNTTGEVSSVLAELERCAEHAARAPSLESLLGIEGQGARTYFGAFSTMLKVPADNGSAFDFTSRNRRPPRDPINALLSLAYSVLSRDWTVTALAVGFDPFLGFYHQPRFGRPALALDLMEEFRPLIADSVVLQAINNGEVRPEHFMRRGPAVALNDEGRKRFFLAYERRMAHLVRHPIFGYRTSYRRLLEVQARLLARHLAGELTDFTGFRTR